MQAKWNINSEREFWTGPLEVGSNGQVMEVIFDTSTDWLALQGIDCEKCEGNTYNSSRSTTAKSVG